MNNVNVTKIQFDNKHVQKIKILEKIPKDKWSQMEYQHHIRLKIYELYNIDHSHKQDIYAIFICLLIGSNELSECNSWGDVSSILERQNFEVRLPQDISMESNSYGSENYQKCCCSQLIEKLYKLDYKDNHIICGCVCIDKTSIQLKNKMKILNKKIKNLKKIFYWCIYIFIGISL